MAAPVLIVGAGIAGLALALELASRNIPFHLMEREKTLLDIGAGLQLTPNAGRLLDRHPGLGAALDAVSASPEALTFQDGRSGSRLASMPLGDAAEHRWGAPYRTIHRADLQRVLLDAVTATGAPPTLDAELLSFRDHAAGVTATLRIGGRTTDMEARALIGADGLRSAVRRAMGDAAPPRAVGQTAWRAMAAIPGAAGNGISLWLCPGAHLVHYPVVGGAAVNLVATTPARAAHPAEAFAPACPEVRRLIAAAGTWTPWPLHERPAERPWVRGHVALLGDSAHAMTPHLAQGAAQAIEDAHALAACLVHARDTASALARYEAQRRPRARAIQRAARRNARLYQLPWPASAARDLVLRRSSPERLMARVDWLFGEQA